MKYAVWTGNDLFAMVFKEDANGNPIGVSDANDPDPFTDSPIYTYCIVDTASISGSHAVTRRGSTGRKHRKLVGSDFEFECSVGNMYLRKEELDRENVFERNKRLSVYFVFLNYMRQPTTQKEWHRLAHSLASSFNITSSENDLCKCSATIQAEEHMHG